MTNSESIAQLGPSAYAKPATALDILREASKTRETRVWLRKTPPPARMARSRASG